MAQWVLVFTPADVRPSDVAQSLLAAGIEGVSLSSARETVDVQRGGERVEVVEADTTSMIAEYDDGELDLVLREIPNPNIFRVSFYRGTTLLSDVLQCMCGLSSRVFIDNDYGVIARLQEALVKGLPSFLRLSK